METNIQSTHYKVPLSYNSNQPIESNTWDGEIYPISIFGTMKFIEIDAKNIYISLLYMTDFIRSRKINISVINRIQKFKEFGNATFNFISSTYEANWNNIHSNKNNNSLRSRITNKFIPKV